MGSNTRQKRCPMQRFLGRQGWYSFECTMTGTTGYHVEDLSAVSL
jgi:hypothetical protein